LDKNPRIKKAILGGTANPGSIVPGGLAGISMEDIKVADSSAFGPSPPGMGLAKLTDQELNKIVEDFASSECFFCGQIMIESVAEPFVYLPDEQNELKSWTI